MLGSIVIPISVFGFSRQQRGGQGRGRENGNGKKDYKEEEFGGLIGGEGRVCMMRRRSVGGGVGGAGAGGGAGGGAGAGAGSGSGGGAVGGAGEEDDKVAPRGQGV